MKIKGRNWWSTVGFNLSTDIVHLTRKAHTQTLHGKCTLPADLVRGRGDSELVFRIKSFMDPVVGLLSMGKTHLIPWDKRGELQVKKTFQGIDTDGCGFLTQKQVLLLCHSMLFKLDEEQQKTVLSEVDPNNTNRVSIDAMVNWWLSDSESWGRWAICVRFDIYYGEDKRKKINAAGEDAGGDSAVSTGPSVPNFQQLLGAAQVGNMKVLNKAKAQGVDLTQSDDGGMTLLHAAASCSTGAAPKTVAWLLKEQVNVDAKDHLSQTPLLKACAALPSSGKHAIPLLRALIHGGATIIGPEGTPVMNNDGLDVFALAQMSGNKKAIDFLAKYAPLPASSTPVAGGIRDNGQGAGGEGQ